tara:strand:+ start:7264 stop:7707 length:444 start_codon:yes stop_codon:yes gene_type:complete
MYGIKNLLLCWAGIEIGRNVRIASSARILGSGRIIIGDNTFIGHFSKILVGGGIIEIGRDVDISSNVTIINGTHNKYDISGKAAGTGFSKNIFIGNGSWIGASVTLIGGVNIGCCSIVAAGATVVSDVPELCLFGGVPAKYICKHRK